MVLHVNSSFEAEEKFDVQNYFSRQRSQWSMCDPDSAVQWLVACEIVSLRRCHSRYQHDRNNIMITSWVLYKHSHTLPLLSLGSLATTENWTRCQLRQKSKHDSRIHKASDPICSWSEGK